MSSDVGEVTDRFKKRMVMRRKGWRMSCAVGKATEGLEEL